MKQKTIFTASFWNKNLFFKLFLFLFTVLLIVYFLPKQEQFKYKFKEKNPWQYGLLTAPFDIPIYKSVDNIRQEKDSLLQEFSPYFEVESTIQKKALETLQRDYNQPNLRKLLPSPKYIHYIDKQLKTIYQRGIINNTIFDSLSNQKVKSVMAIEQKVAQKRLTADLFTERTAYAFILQSDTTNYNLNILRQIGLNKYILPNLTYDETRSNTSLHDLLTYIPMTTGIVLKGQKIVDRGEIINGKTYQILKSFARESEQRELSNSQTTLILIGQIIFVSLVILIFMWYLESNRKQYFTEYKRTLLFFSSIVLFSIITSLLVRHPIASVYVIPYVALPVIIRILVETRTAFMAHITCTLLCSISLTYPYEFIVIQIIAGLVAIYSLQQLTERSQLLRTTVYVLISYFVSYFAIELIRNHGIDNINISRYIHFSINAVFLLFTYPLLPVIERLSGDVTAVTLSELSDTSKTLLRELSENVPGTFQHSMQVANLAAAAANKIGANAQLVRTGALYHDIGKMVNPTFFTENQRGYNPHDDISYEQSAHMIINHVTEGLKLADKYNLPIILRDFINTHHGRGKTKYFYISWINDHPNEEVDAELFTYPGPNPSTKEQAILMMADAVEASSRALKEYTDLEISLLVDRIVDSQLEEGFFKMCPITFLEINMVKETFKDKLRTMYHTRVSYPTLNKKEEKTPKVQTQK
ncbi:MAG: HDIG domain-containing metalloprotein [Bacteroidaceae bacterium]